MISWFDPPLEKPINNTLHPPLISSSFSGGTTPSQTPTVPCSGRDPSSGLAFDVGPYLLTSPFTAREHHLNTYQQLPPCTAVTWPSVLSGPSISATTFHCRTSYPPVPRGHLQFVQHPSNHSHLSALTDSPEFIVQPAWLRISTLSALLPLKTGYRVAFQ